MHTSCNPVGGRSDDQVQPCRVVPARSSSHQTIFGRFDGPPEPSTSPCRTWTATSHRSKTGLLFFGLFKTCHMVLENLASGTAMAITWHSSRPDSSFRPVALHSTERRSMANAGVAMATSDCHLVFNLHICNVFSWRVVLRKDV